MQRVTFELPAGTFHALEGEGARRLVFLHGFPDHPPTAHAFFDELAARGYRVLAPWLRGYAPSPRTGPYDPLTLADDVVDLIDAWSPDEPVDLVGHDWGAAIAYIVCTFAPERIGRAVTLAFPHPRTWVRELRSTLAQAQASWYTGVFQLPGSTWLASRDDFALIDKLWRAWSPGYRLPEAERIALHDTLRASMPGPLEYYRDALRHGRTFLRLELPLITIPMLTLLGADDGAIRPPAADDGPRFGAPYERDVLPGLGHFLHLEAPAQIAERIAAFHA